MLFSLNDMQCEKELSSSHSSLEVVIDKTLSTISFNLGGGHFPLREVNM